MLHNWPFPEWKEIIVCLCVCVCVCVSNIEKDDEKMRGEDVNWILQALGGVQWVILVMQ